MRPKTTIRDVARRAGVAKSTVSRVFTPGAPVSLKTRQRVEAAARELGYRPDPLARALSIRQTAIVAVVVSNAESVHIGQVVRGISGVLSRGGYSVIVVDSAEDFGRTGQVGKPLSHQLVDGILELYGAAREEVRDLAPVRPVVCVGDPPRGFAADYVGIGYGEAFQSLCGWLQEQGNRTLCLVTGPETPAVQAQAGLFQEAARSCGLDLPGHRILHTGWTPYSGTRAVREILHWEVRPDVVVCSSDLVAFGVLRAFHEKGVRVPGDVGVCGLDDTLLSKYTVPSLTTLRFSPFRLGMEAGRRMLERLEDPGGEKRQSVLPAGIVRRESVGPKKRGETQ